MDGYHQRRIKYMGEPYGQTYSQADPADDCREVKTAASQADTSAATCRPQGGRLFFIPPKRTPKCLHVTNKSRTFAYQSRKRHTDYDRRREKRR